MKQSPYPDERDLTSVRMEYNYEGERGFWGFVLAIMLFGFVFAASEMINDEPAAPPPVITYRRHKEQNSEPEPDKVGDGRDSFWCPKVRQYAALVGAAR